MKRRQYKTRFQSKYVIYLYSTRRTSLCSVYINKQLSKYVLNRSYKVVEEISFLMKRIFQKKYMTGKSVIQKSIRVIKNFWGGVVTNIMYCLFDLVDGYARKI